MLVAPTFEYPFRGMMLLCRSNFVVLLDLVDDADEPIQLRSLRRLAGAIARRNRETHHVGDRPGINPEAATRVAMAQTVTLNRKAEATIQFHDLHPPTLCLMGQGISLPLFYTNRRKD